MSTRRARNKVRSAFWSSPGYCLSESGGLRRSVEDAMATGKEQVVPPRSAPQHGDAGPQRNLMAHLREPRARNEERDAHLRALDDHLGCEPPGRIEHFI